MYTSEFPIFYVTVDIAILAMHEERLHLLVIRRAGEPYAGRWALPGGFVDEGEDLATAAERELQEETGVELARHTLDQVGAYGAPDRDPRHRVVSVAWLAAFPEPVEVRAGDDAAEAAWLPVDDLLSESGRAELAFDHAQIISDCVALARDLLEGPDARRVAGAFLDEEFTLSELRAVFEAVHGRSLDPGNFQRAMRETRALVEGTGRTRPPAAGRGRPAELFRMRAAE